MGTQVGYTSTVKQATNGTSEGHKQVKQGLGKERKGPKRASEKIGETEENGFQKRGKKSDKKRPGIGEKRR